MPQSKAGFTLIELMIVMVIVAILLAVAIPSFNQHVQRGQMKSALSNFITAVAYARSQATSLNTEVHVFSKNSGDWTGGWCVTTNSAACGTVNDSLLREFDGPSSVNLAGNSDTALFSFNSRGFLTSNSSFISLCSDENAGKRITVLALGQALAQPCDCTSSKVCSSS